jgi:hypothetical protein
MSGTITKNNVTIHFHVSSWLGNAFYNVYAEHVEGSNLQLTASSVSVSAIKDKDKGDNSIYVN